VSTQPPVTLLGKGVILRPFRNDELEVWETGFTRLGREAAPQSSQDPKGLRARIEASGKLRGGRIDLGIEVDGELIGHIQTYRPRDRSLPHRVYEIGVALWDAADRGKGYGEEAVRLFVDWLFQQGVERVQAGTAMRNRPMRRVLEKLGFRVFGELDIQGVHELLYGVSASDWTTAE
jgi:RimJ/RimL family protein N-acetyltransferase